MSETYRWLPPILILAAVTLALATGSCRSTDPAPTCQQLMLDDLAMCLRTVSAPKDYLRDLCQDEYDERVRLCL